MVNYITTIISKEYMSVGGFGHVFYDVLTAYILAEKYNLKFVYSPIDSLSDDYHRIVGKKRKIHKIKKISWDNFLKLDNNELNIKDIEKLNLSKEKINLCKSFFSFPLIKFENIIRNKNNTLFILTNNNRVYLNEIYHLDKNLFNRIYKKLKNKLLHLESKNHKKTLALHIRQGDWTNVPIKYYQNFLNLYDTSKYEINIFSVGSCKQMNNIKNLLKDYEVNYYLNTDVFDTFKKIYNSDIIVAGQSNFPKIIALFSKAKLIYLPYKDGECKPLGINRKFKLYHLGTKPELFDEKNRIFTNISCNLNRDKILEIL